MNGNTKVVVWIRAWLVALMGLGLAACASTEVDPYEDFNRSVSSFNNTTDKYFFKPIAQGYQAVLPQPVENSISNFFSNLNDPWVAINQLLQGKPKLALRDAGRFLVNSTMGIGGLFDLGDEMGLTKHQEDFGQTLATWGVPRGPYIVLPFLGPSSGRGLASQFVGNFGGNIQQPLRYIDHVPTRNTLFFTQLISLRASLLRAGSFASGDQYLFLRDAYLQRQEYLINDGVVEDSFLN
ncbi:MAG: VacJ family lipoprotein [Pseudohongiellaceae bacterium]